MACTDSFKNAVVRVASVKTIKIDSLDPMTIAKAKRPNKSKERGRNKTTSENDIFADLPAHAARFIA